MKCKSAKRYTINSCSRTIHGLKATYYINLPGKPIQIVGTGQRKSISL